MNPLHPALRCPPSSAYWVQALAHHAPNGQIYNLGDAVRATPLLALRWLRDRASDIADQLDPPAAHRLRAWSSHTATHEHALSLLAQGGAYTYVVVEEGTRYVLLADALPYDVQRP